MPAEDARHVGVKIVSVADANPALGRPRIQGLYVLMDAETLTPVWQCDAAALTVARTTAMSMLAVRAIGRVRADRAAVIGSGPQARAHAEAVVELGLAGRCYMVGRATLADERAEVLRGAGLVMCCTSAREPLFDDSLIGPEAVVVAIGSHRPDERELPAALMARASIVVDGRSARATAGDVLLAEQELGKSLPAVTLGDVVRGSASVAAQGTCVFKSVGESWQDLAVATVMAGAEL
jgi:ornithine cyclodeaminase